MHNYEQCPYELSLQYILLNSMNKLTNNYKNIAVLRSQSLT